MSQALRDNLTKPGVEMEGVVVCVLFFLRALLSKYAAISSALSTWSCAGPLRPPHTVTPLHSSLPTVAKYPEPSRLENVPR